MPLRYSQRRRYLLRGMLELWRGRGRARSWRPDAASASLRELAGGGASPLRLYGSSVLERFSREHVAAGTLVCDVGAGHGGNARALAESRHARYLAIDVVASAQWVPADRRWYVRGSALAIPVRDGSVDVVVTASSLEHIPQIEAAAAELARVLRPGGAGCHIVPAPSSLLLYGYHGYRRFAPAELRRVFEREGIVIVELHALGGLASFLLHLVWITWLETGAIYSVLTLGAIPRGRGLGPRLRRGRPLAIYARLLRRAVTLDRYLPMAPLAYAVFVRRAT